MGVEKVLKNVKLPTLSKTLNKIIELEKKNPVSISNDIIKVIEKDPMLSVHILKIANSPLFGFAKNVRSISHAVNLLGIPQIRNIAFSFSIFDFIKKVKYSNEYGKIFKKILRRSLMMSAISGIIAKKISDLNFDELYISGLISNLGQIILFLYSPKKYSSIYIDDGIIPELEQKEFKTDFIEVGVAFCQREGLPSFLQVAIRNQFKLSEKTKSNKVIFISSRITDFLLVEDHEKKEVLFKQLDKDIKKYLDLSMEDIDNTIKDLPLVMDSFMKDFPELQTGLNKIINTSSKIIISLMKKELDMVLQSREQENREKHISKEKTFITHMLSLSQQFSVLLQPDKLISILLNYFKENLPQYNIKILYGNRQKFGLKYHCENKDLNESVIEVKSVNILKQLINRDEPHFASNEDVKKLGLENEFNHIVFPISYHKNNFGFLILGLDNKLMKNVDYVIPYIRILTNIIANSVQNYNSFLNIKVEKKKKDQIINELIKNDEKLFDYQTNETSLSRSRALEEVLPVIFHKLKNKLTPILGYSQLLKNLSKEDKTIEKLKKIERNALELTNHLESLRFYFQSKKLNKKYENINEIILKMEPFFLKIEEASNVLIELELDHSIPNFMLNRGHIINLIMNLVENAVDSLEIKDEQLKRIEIKTILEDGAVKLVVKDNGIGVDPEDINKIWTPFYTTSTTKAGIGLTICEKILSHYKTKYNINSNKGSFTEFIVEFSILESEEENELEKKEKSTNKSAKILIVDDEEPLVVLMKEILQVDENLDIITATKGEEALKLINENEFNVVVSDIHMPGIDGIAIYKHLKSKGMSDRLVMVTANPYITNISDFLKQNKIKYLKKPFELMEFRRLVNEKIDNE